MGTYADFIGGETDELTRRLNEDILAALNGIGGNLLELGITYAYKDAPYMRLKDSGPSGIDMRWVNDGGIFQVQLNTGTEAVPIWTEIATFDLSNRAFYVGHPTDTEAGKLHVVDGGSDNKPGVLVLYSDAGADYFLWIDTAGNLRAHTAAPTDDDADGVVIYTAGQANVPANRQVATTGALSGGGDLSTNRTLDVATKGIGVAHLADAVQDLLEKASISVGIESGDHILVTVQLQDAASNSLAARGGFYYWLADSAYAAKSSTGPSSLSISTGFQIAEQSTRISGWAGTDANGTAVFDLGQSGAFTRYLHIMFGGAVYVSAAITFA